MKCGKKFKYDSPKHSEYEVAMKLRNDVQDLCREIINVQLY